MQLLATRDAWWIAQCEAALEALGFQGTWEAVEGHPTAFALEIHAAAAAPVSSMLSELLAEELLAQELLAREQLSAAEGQGGGAAASQVGIFWRPAFATALCSGILLLVFHAVVGGAQAGSLWQARGGCVRQLVVQGHQAYRLITAATLHADLGHALSNATFIVVLGWAAAERLGSGVAAAAWLATAVAGFAVTLLGSDIEASIGASGGLFGLLGCAAGHAWRQTDSRLTPRRRRQVLGAALMLLAMTAFNPEANRWAHLGGFAAGLPIGGLLPRLGRWGQVLMALVTSGVLIGAWAVAWHSNGLKEPLPLR